MNEKLAAEAYILYSIDELDAATEKKVMSSLKRAPYQSVGEFLQEYESEESISEDIVEWLKDEWTDFKQQYPNKTASQFAKMKVSEFLSALE